MVYCMGSVHSRYTAGTAVDLQCTLHYTAGTLHFGLGLAQNIAFISTLLGKNLMLTPNIAFVIHTGGYKI